MKKKIGDRLVILDTADGSRVYLCFLLRRLGTDHEMTRVGWMQKENTPH